MLSPMHALQATPTPNPSTQRPNTPSTWEIYAPSIRVHMFKNDLECTFGISLPWNSCSLVLLCPYTWHMQHMPCHAVHDLILQECWIAAANAWKIFCKPTSSTPSWYITCVPCRKPSVNTSHFLASITLFMQTSVFTAVWCSHVIHHYSSCTLDSALQVLYVVSKEKNKVGWKLVTTRLILEAIQLFLIVVNPRYGFTIDATNKWVQQAGDCDKWMQ